MRRALLALALAVPVSAAAQEAPAPYRQSDAVLARFPAVAGVVPGSPWFAPGRVHDPRAEGTGFTSQAEMEAFVARLAQSANASAGSLGRSGQGRDMPFLIFSDARPATLEAARALDRPVVWIIGQQHGNEPAGGEAALAIAHDLAAGGPLAEVTRALTVVVVPRANPDGAAAFTRDTSARMDMNRDHLLLTLPESRAIHGGVRRLPPDLVLDLHEFAVAGRWIDKFGALYGADLIHQRATHPLVPAQVTALADRLFLPAIEAGAASAGITTFVYQTTPSPRPDDRRVATGGNAAGIARNAFGLSGAVSILLETRGVGIAEQSFQRRVASHLFAATAVLRAAAAEPRALRAAVAEGRRALAASREDLVVAHRLPPVTFPVPLIEPATGAPRPVLVEFQDARRFEPTVTAPRPLAYALLAPAAEMRTALALRGIAGCVTTAAGEVEADRFTVTERAEVDRRSINPDGGVRVSAERARMAVPEGALLLPLAQPAGGILVAALDPDAPGSFAAVGLLEAGADGRVPVLRIPAGASLPASRAEGGAGISCP